MRSVDCRMTFTRKAAQVKIARIMELLAERPRHVAELAELLPSSSRNALVYLTYSERLIEGSPMNSVTAVAVDRAQPIPLK